MNKITKQQRCIKMRNNTSIWIDTDRADNLSKALQSGTSGKFIEVGNNLLNIADIMGIFSPETLEEYNREKNGEWQCKYGNWHKRGQECNCSSKNTPNSVVYGQEKARIEKVMEDGVEKVRFI